MNETNQYLLDTRKSRDVDGYIFLNIRPRLECADGFIMSVQASQGHYCTPRNDDGPYSAVEIGYPSAPESLLAEYAENPESLTDTVYGYVPVAVVDAVIEKHGGKARQ